MSSVCVWRNIMYYMYISSTGFKPFIRQLRFNTWHFWELYSQTRLRSGSCVVAFRRPHATTSPGLKLDTSSQRNRISSPNTISAGVYPVMWKKPAIPGSLVVRDNFGQIFVHSPVHSPDYTFCTVMHCRGPCLIPGPYKCSGWEQTWSLFLGTSVARSEPQTDKYRPLPEHQL